uniref:RING-type domain-containing protein n=2 Tax=Caenorhabditis tropicalis TaxID=1561998 RepID=A0A1I7TLV6_9PELO
MFFNNVLMFIIFPEIKMPSVSSSSTTNTHSMNTRGKKRQVDGSSDNAELLKTRRIEILTQQRDELKTEREAHINENKKILRKRAVLNRELEESCVADQKRNVEELNMLEQLDGAEERQKNLGIQLARDNLKVINVKAERYENEHDLKSTIYGNSSLDGHAEIHRAVNDLKRCPVCKDDFNKTDRVPLAIQCGHLFCRECCLQYWRMQLEETQNFCALCRKEFEFKENEGVDALPVCQAVLSLL